MELSSQLSSLKTDFKPWFSQNKVVKLNCQGLKSSCGKVLDFFPRIFRVYITNKSMKYACRTFNFPAGTKRSGSWSARTKTNIWRSDHCKTSEVIDSDGVRYGQRRSVFWIQDMLQFAVLRHISYLLFYPSICKIEIARRRGKRLQKNSNS